MNFGFATQTQERGRERGEQMKKEGKERKREIVKCVCVHEISLSICDFLSRILYTRIPIELVHVRIQFIAIGLIC